MKCKDIIKMLEELAPPSYACGWDNPGLICGRKEKEVRKILVALDATNKAVDKAVEIGADMILTHHPMIFSAMKQINDDSFIGHKVLTMAERGICCYAMHTNYDIAGGMAEICGAKMGLMNPEPFEVMGELEDRPVGIGQVGRLPEKMTLAQCAAKVKEAFGLSNVLVFGDLDRMVEFAAVSPGSGRSMIKEADKKKVDVLITGDIGHHEGLDSMDMGFAVIEAGHYGLEQVFIGHLCEYIESFGEGLEAVPFFEGMPYQVL